MSDDNIRRSVMVVRIATFTILIMILVLLGINLYKCPELATPEGIVKIMPQNKFLAVAEFWLLYILKGISVFFPSAILNIAVGMLFELPIAILVSGVGIFLEFLIIYYIGRLQESTMTDAIIGKYPKIKKFKQFNINNSFFMSFLLRILGVVSYDIGSFYLGVSRVKLLPFIAGSMLGAMINVILANIFGKFVFDPFCWQVWLVIAIRVLLIAMSFLLSRVLSRKYCRKNNVI